MRSISHLVSLLLLFLASACGGGGGGGAPQLNAGVDLTGLWQVQQTVTALSGDCGMQQVGDMETGLISIDFNANTRRIIIDPNTAEARVGVVSGTRASIVGSLTSNGRTQDFDIQIEFAPDGNSFSGTVVFTETDGTTSCTRTLEVAGTRVAAGSALTVQSTSPAQGQQDVAFDAPIEVQFSTDLDAGSIGGVTLEGPDGSVSGQARVQGNVLVFEPAMLLAPRADFRLRFENVLGTNGSLLAGVDSLAFSTQFISEDFRYAIAENASAAAFLDTESGGGVVVTPGSLGGLSPGQLWRFTFDNRFGGTDFFLLRNDVFVNERSLEGGDGTGPAIMVGINPPGPFTGQFIDPSINGGALVLRTQFQGANRALGRAPGATAGTTDAIMQDFTFGDPGTEWRLFAIERIVSPFTLVPITENEVVSGQFEATDAVGLRAPNTRVDLYLLTLSNNTRLTVTMRSAAGTTGIDSFLALLDDNCLNDPDLANWRTQCTLAFDDDGGGNDPGALSSVDAKLDGVVLAPGRYVIAATYFDDTLRTGPYTLETAAAPPRVAFPEPLPALAPDAWPGLQK